MQAYIYNFKLVSAIFWQIFVFDQMVPLQKLWKILFISSKKLFSFPEVFKFLYFHLPFIFSLSAIALKRAPRWILKFMTSSIV